MSKATLSIVRQHWSLEAYATGLNTEIQIWGPDDQASMDLTWVEAQQLYRWLKERLGE